MTEPRPLGGDLVVIVPSRGRPQNAEALARAVFDTAERDDTRFILAVDDDDPHRASYLEVARRWQGVLIFIPGPRLRLAGTLNAIATQMAARPENAAIGFMGDDHRPRTLGWDRRIRDALATPPSSPTGPGPAFAYGNDLVHGERIPTSIFMTKSVVSTLGYVVPTARPTSTDRNPTAPPLTHLHLDTVWREWATAIDRRCYLPGVVIEHVHPIAGKAAWDDGYAEANSPTQYQQDQDAYDAYHARTGPGGFDDDVRKLRRATA